MKKKLLLLGAMSVLGLAMASPGNNAPTFNQQKRNTFIADLQYSEQTAYNQKAMELNKELCREGMVLLKNRNNALPFGGDISKVSIFGKASVDLQYGGGGSGSGSVASGITQVDLQKSLKDAGYEINPKLTSFYKDDTKSEVQRTNGNSNWKGISEATVGETSLVKYTDDVLESIDEYNDAAIMVLARGGTEGADCKTYDARDHDQKHDSNNRCTPESKELSERHYLELSKNEEDLLEMIKTKGFKKIVVLINSGNAFECAKLDADDKVDAILWMGVPGANGAAAVGEILNGTVNPSGKTVDTWERDFTLNPTFQNFADNSQTNIDPETKVEYAADTMFNADGSPVNSSSTVRKADGSVYWANEEHKVVKGGLNGVRASSYVSYEEGVYMDYRYYETIYADKLAKNKTEADDWYNGEHGVIYPFGHGLSYTTFEQTIVDCDARGALLHKSSEKVNITVKVKNTGDVAGKDVVQVYWHAPYTPGGIEKASEVLCAFDKTKMLEPGEEQTLKLSFYLQDVANYDCFDANKNGFMGYELEGGNYQITINKNAHVAYETVETRVMKGGIKYDTDRVTGHEVKNRFTNAGFYSSLPGKLDVGFDQFHRDHPDTTFPSHPTMADRTLKEGSRVEEFYTHVFTLDDIELTETYEYMPKVVKKTKEDIEKLGWTQPASTSAASSDIKFAEMVGVPMDDPKWDEFMNQLTYAEMDGFVTGGSTHNPAISRLGKPSSSDSDGPSKFSTMWWCGEGTIAATYNVELAFQEGECIGIEGHQQGSGWGGGEKYGWCGPGVNLHRSPFVGRNFEYYSADPFLTGRIGGRVVAGASDKGIYCFFKHFAVNDQEKNREGVTCYLTEQALRELYLKPFQMIVQEGKSMGIMSSYNRLGLMETAASYPLLTEVLRQEWGFKGSIISDMTHRGNSDINVHSYENVNPRILAGCNNQLDSQDYTPDVNATWDADAFDGKGCPVYTSKATGEEVESYSWWYAVRQNAKECLWMCANSGAMARSFYLKADLELSGVEKGIYSCKKGEEVNIEITIPDELKAGGTYNDKAITECALVIDPVTPLPEGLVLEDGAIKGTPTVTANQFVHVLVELTLEGDENPTYLGRSFELFVREVIPDDTPAPESGVNVGMVIGLSAGGVAIMAGIAVALILVFKKKKA